MTVLGVNVGRELSSLNYRQVTWVGAALVIGAVELVAGIRGDPLLTEAMRSGSARWLLWPVLFGIFLGHFFGQRLGPGWGPWLLVALGAWVVYRDLFIKTSVPLMTQLECFLLFFALGAVLFGKGS